jgi:hypothetical protein
MVKILLIALVIAAGVAGSAMLWQHLRYLGLRRDVVQDRQAVFHSSSAFHALTFLSLAPGTDGIDEVRALKAASVGTEVEWIYAGKVVLSPLPSEQIGVKDWDAVVLLQYPSRSDFDRHAQSEEWRRALGRFAETYTQGFQRSRNVSALFPQLLLGLRVGQIVRGRPSHFPFVRAQSTENFPEAPEFAARLLDGREFGSDAVVVVNLLKDGTPEEQAADRAYGASMFGAMAEGAYGPIHVGRAVRVERDYTFDQIAIVYYPGVKFFGDMINSEYYQRIYRNKQLNDSQAVITAPILDRVEAEQGS